MDGAMDPLTVGIAASLYALWKTSNDKRRAADLVLIEWDQKLRAVKGATGQRIAIPKAVRLALEVKEGERCAYHRTSACSEGALTVDHRRSIADGGNNYSENLQLVCRKHNSSKNKASELEFKHGIRPPRPRPVK
jgi:5-methylcytosine-specific restriction endonuclease McrA